MGHTTMQKEKKNNLFWILHLILVQILDTKTFDNFICLMIFYEEVFVWKAMHDTSTMAWNNGVKLSGCPEKQETHSQ